MQVRKLGSLVLLLKKASVFMRELQQTYSAVDTSGRIPPKSNKHEDVISSE